MAIRTSKSDPPAPEAGSSLDQKIEKLTEKVLALEERIESLISAPGQHEKALQEVRAQLAETVEKLNALSAERVKRDKDESNGAGSSRGRREVRQTEGILDGGFFE